ncbi:MAG: methyltransferase domain-containing protein, partial [Planctomycetales bacterium]|nr:methyltransferase domain-containing protein [Planctomycetales bacterium]NIM08860.1 methyltransferase domain-containing protein [Planctomycetales bacterium]NIN08320.1 methyltransferase domain-containing protein [Planctomycetales bacterium]NIN77449.1 methyltransferase domain-containing protein [Planctomycetales bacterium]NIO34621.1 methyltransferase domain-containing protein [Planctomycetales bacterium]
MSLKDFGPIEDDYAFFMKSATEAQGDRAELLKELRQRFSAASETSWLDFGCGSGEFSESLLDELAFPAQQLQLSLLEPVSKHLGQAVERLSRYTSATIPRHASPETLSAGGYDFVLANHSAYYVHSAAEMTELLPKILRSPGMAILAIAGADNFLVRLWKFGFHSIGREIPYWIAEDYCA